MFLSPGDQSLLLLALTGALLVNTVVFCGEFQQLSARIKFLDSSNHIA